MYKYMPNSVVKISVIFAEYFEYYIIILGGGAFFRGHAVYRQVYIGRVYQSEHMMAA